MTLHSENSRCDTRPAHKNENFCASLTSLKKTETTVTNKERHEDSSATHSSHHKFKTGGEAPAASFLRLQTHNTNTQTRVCVRSTEETVRWILALQQQVGFLCWAHFLVGGALAGSLQSGSVASDMYKLPEPSEVRWGQQKLDLKKRQHKHIVSFKKKI